MAALTRHGLVMASFLPLGLLSFAGLRRRSLVRGSILAIACMLTIGAMTGCSSGKMASPTAPPTPSAPATTQITITATSGALSHSVPVTLTTN
jgi:hypothetical protein